MAGRINGRLPVQRCPLHSAVDFDEYLMAEIDILLATYNGERFIAEQLDSLLRQTWPDFRVLVRDDGSSDSTPDILKRYAAAYPAHITLCEDHRNLGVIGNFAELMRLSDAPYIMFCDQDDVWLPGKVETSFAALRRLEHRHGGEVPLLVHTDLRVVNEALETMAPSFLRQARLQTGHTLGRLLIKNNVTGCTTLFNRALLEKALPIPDNCLMHDWWIALVAAAFGHVSLLPRADILYRQHGRNVAGQICYNWGYVISAFVSGMRAGSWRRLRKQGILKTIEQAELFFKQYEAELKPADRRVMHALLSLEHGSAVRRRVDILRFGLRDASFIRTIGMLIAV